MKWSMPSFLKIKRRLWRLAGNLLLAKVISTLSRRLEASGAESALLDARILTGLALGLDRPVYGHEDFELDAAATSRLDALAMRREAGEPVSRMRGWREFWSMRFILSPACLDPRPDSETLVRAAIEKCRQKTGKPLKILDYGTGSGCLLLAVLSECKEAEGIGVDRQPEAISTALANARYHKLDDRIRLLVSHWCDALVDEEKADIILANPPYIPSADIDALSREVRFHDPILALDGGADGLMAWRELMPRICQRLLPDGIALLEIGQGQEREIAALAEAHGLSVGEGWHDLAGILRVMAINNSNK
jgi:release factor glutamine methyltransferase